jgi:hypothetical protein
MLPSGCKCTSMFNVLRKVRHAQECQMKLVWRTAGLL